MTWGHALKVTIALYMVPPRAPGNSPSNAIPPKQPRQGGGLAIHDHPSRSNMLCLVPPIRYVTGYLHAVFTTPYMPIQSVYNVLLPMKYLYSSHILAASYYQDLMCYTYVLATCCLYTDTLSIYMIPL